MGCKYINYTYAYANAIYGVVYNGMLMKVSTRESWKSKISIKIVSGQQQWFRFEKSPKIMEIELEA